jgi:N6-adenosine-specific RNA methylase IME4
MVRIDSGPYMPPTWPSRGDQHANAGEGYITEDFNALVRGGKRFAVILADPPWRYRVYRGQNKRRSAERHYKPGSSGEASQSIDELKQMPISKLAADNCALFLWAVCPGFPGASEVMKAWGFDYQDAAFVWVKLTKRSTGITAEGKGLHWGMGYWTRANIEPCLLGIRGSPQCLADDVDQTIVSPVREHSRKPDETHARIERLFAGPYLELYARRPIPGWTVWGNQIPGPSNMQHCGGEQMVPEQ